VSCGETYRDQRPGLAASMDLLTGKTRFEEFTRALASPVPHYSVARRIGRIDHAKRWTWSEADVDWSSPRRCSSPANRGDPDPAAGAPKNRRHRPTRTDAETASAVSDTAGIERR